jgi:cell fate regulator YaaT (PSP1 superfamily)
MTALAQQHTAHIKPLLVSVRDARQMLGGVGRTKIYQLMDLGKLRSVSIGRRRMLVTASIERLVDEMLDKKD